MSDEMPQTANTAQSMDSVPADTPSSAPEASASEVVLTPVKDDNLSQNVPKSQPAEPVQTPQTDENSAPVSEPTQSTTSTLKIPSTPPETPMAQTPPTEPLEKSSEPNVSKPEPIFSVPASTPTPAEPVSPKPNLARQLIAKAREAIQSRKRKKIDHVMDLFAKRTNITNNQVADFIHVSDATATRYLEILENENRIRQVGKTGKGVKYEKI
jgi:hypothetical protein